MDNFKKKKNHLNKLNQKKLNKHNIKYYNP